MQQATNTATTATAIAVAIAEIKALQDRIGEDMDAFADLLDDVSDRLIPEVEAFLQLEYSDEECAEPIECLRTAAANIRAESDSLRAANCRLRAVAMSGS